MEKMYQWDLTPGIPDTIKDLLSSDLKIKIFEIVKTKRHSFAPQEIVDELAKSGTNIEVNIVQQFLRRLHLRNYLSVSDFRGEKRRGRSSLRYQLNISL